MNSYSTYVNVANLPKDLQDRVKVALSDETKENIEKITIDGVFLNSLISDLLVEQRLTNKYLAEMLGDTITEIDQ